MAALNSPFLPTTEAARYLGQDAAGEPLVKPRTLERWRREARGPAFFKLGRRCAYRVSDLDEWAESRKRNSTSAA